RHPRLVSDWSPDVCSADLEAKRDVGDDSGTAITDAGGRFRIDSLAGGSYALTVRARRGAPQALRWADSAPPRVQLANGHARADEVGRASWRGRGWISGGEV